MIFFTINWLFLFKTTELSIKLDNNSDIRKICKNQISKKQRKYILLLYKVFSSQKSSMYRITL